MRERAHLSQVQLAERIGAANPDSVRRWEKGEVEPSATMFIRIVATISATLLELEGRQASTNRAALYSTNAKWANVRSGEFRCALCRKAITGRGETGLCTQCITQSAWDARSNQS